MSKSFERVMTSSFVNSLPRLDVSHAYCTRELLVQVAFFTTRDVDAGEELTWVHYYNSVVSIHVHSI